MSMDFTAQRIAIAEACGWTNIRFLENVGLVGTQPRGWDPVKLPDYLTDLNAMHEAEKPMGRLYQCANWRYCRHLTRKCRADLGVDLEEEHDPVKFTTHATAAQRAEAFLRTIRKWRDDQ
jgi:hypothetical protein